MPRKGRGDRDWRRYERDWKGYERYRRDEVTLFLTKAKNLVEANPAPWTAGKMGQPPYPPKAMLTLSATEVAGIHASTVMVLCWVGIPLLRFHPHPSHRRSIGQAIGLTAYPPQRVAIFTMPLLT
jgi:hypothetical protein